MDEEFLAGKLNALQLAIIALVTLSVGKEKFLPEYQALCRALQEGLLERDQPQALVDGLAFQSAALQSLLRQDGT